MKRILFLVFSTTLLVFGGWLTILGNLDPNNIGPYGLLAFFILFFLWLWGCLILLNYFLRVSSNKWELIYLPFKIAIRQSLFLTLAIVGLLFFWVLEVLNWLSAGVFLLLVISLEFYFQSRGFKIGERL